MYFATTGYDLASGWGTPKGQSLIDALASGSSGFVLAAKANFEAEGACNPGPIAGTVATYIAEVSGGWPPYSYQWNSKTLMGPGISTAQTVAVIVPTSGGGG